MYKIIASYAFTFNFVYSIYSFSKFNFTYSVYCFSKFTEYLFLESKTFVSSFLTKCHVYLFVFLLSAGFIPSALI